jgi:hypothetical protein
MLTELLRREKEAKIKPDPDVDAYMKVRNKSLKFLFEMLNTSLCNDSFKTMQAAALEGQQASVVTDYILKVRV